MTELVLALVGVSLAHLVAVISPGPSFLLVARTAMGSSRSEGMAAALGMAVGALVWAVAALFGLAVLLAQFEWLYTALRIAGGAYLLFLAVMLWRHAPEPIAGLEQPVTTRRDHRRAFFDALFVQLANPKVVIFFGSIFVALLPRDLPGWVAIALLGVMFIDEFLWYAAVAAFFSAGRAQQAYRRWKLVADRTAAGALALIGCKLVVGR